MSAYHYLTPTEREYIMVQRAKGRSITAIAAALGRSKSTISRELKRNNSGGSYSASKAQEQYDNRRLVCRRKRKLDDPELFALVKDRFLKEHWSPEQIQYRLRREDSPHSISYATIYRGIYAGRFNDPDRVKSGKQRLRHRGKQRRRKGDPARDNFPVVHELSERPPEAQARARIGDWEADTVAGVVGGAVLLTLVDRKSHYLHCVRLEKKTADGVNAAMIEVLHGQTVHSITPDRGKEFARHAVAAEALGVKIYSHPPKASYGVASPRRTTAYCLRRCALSETFGGWLYIPPPYQPWQRGTNENTNGLLREYFPKYQDIAQYPDEYIEKAVLALNNRPHKCLQWRTPYEVYFEEVLHLV